MRIGPGAHPIPYQSQSLDEREISHIIPTATGANYNPAGQRDPGITYAENHRSLNFENTAVCSLTVVLHEYVGTAGGQDKLAVTRYNITVRGNNRPTRSEGSILPKIVCKRATLTFLH